MLCEVASINSRIQTKLSYITLLFYLCPKLFIIISSDIYICQFIYTELNLCQVQSSEVSSCSVWHNVIKQIYAFFHLSPKGGSYFPRCAKGYYLYWGHCSGYHLLMHYCWPLLKGIFISSIYMATSDSSSEDFLSLTWVANFSSGKHCLSGQTNEYFSHGFIFWPINIW